jgi:hypothetical protein
MSAKRNGRKINSMEKSGRCRGGYIATTTGSVGIKSIETKKLPIKNYQISSPPSP